MLQLHDLVNFHTIMLVQDYEQYPSLLYIHILLGSPNDKYESIYVC